MFAHMYVNSLFSIPSEGCVSTATLLGLVFPFVSIVGVPKTNVKLLYSTTYEQKGQIHDRSATCCLMPL